VKWSEDNFEFYKRYGRGSPVRNTRDIESGYRTEEEVSMVGPEATIEQDACDYAEQCGLSHRKCCWIGKRGAPDRIFWGPDVPVFFIEFKAPDGRLSHAQTLTIASLREAGTLVSVCSSLGEAQQAIREATVCRGC